MKLKKGKGLKKASGKSGKRKESRKKESRKSVEQIEKRVRIYEAEKVENEQSEKHLSRKRHRKSGSHSPNLKRKRVSFAIDLEKTKIYDKRHKLQITPSLAAPGKSIIVRKDGEDSFSSPATPKKPKKSFKKKDISDHLTTEQNHENGGKVEEVEQETLMEPAVSSATENSKEKESEKLNGDKPRENGITKSRKTGGKKKIQVTRKVKEKLLQMPRKERKMYIRELRKKRKPNFDLALRCKVLWEKLRSGKTKETERKKLASEVHGMVKGKVKELIFAHDTCRVVESMVTSGGNDIRSALFEELTPEIIHMAKSKYARFFVTKMLKHGSSAQRQIIFDAFRGHCVSLLRITSAAQVLETAYNDYANAQQRYNIVIEFYGVDFAYFKAADARIRTLSEIIADDPSRKQSIIKYLEQLLTDIVDKPQIKLSLTHRLLSDFFQFADNKQQEEMIDSLKLSIPEIVHTSDGVRTAMKCLWNSSAKERKVMLKNFKGLVTKTCLEEFAHRFLIAVFDTVDDTVLVSKCLLKELVDNVDQIIKSNYGVKVLHHLIHPRDPRFFSASQVAIYKEGDENPHSKKDRKVRYAELFAYIQKPFCKYFAANMDSLIHENQVSLLVLDLLEAPTGLDLFERNVDAEDRAACYDAIASACSREFIPCDTEQLHPIEHPQAHFVISKLLKSDSKLDIKLSDFIIKQCGEQLPSWLACNKGCFILLHMLENATESVQKFLKQALPLSSVERYHTKGAATLIQKLKS